MAVPKRKHSNSRTGTRRSHDHKVAAQLTICSQCSKAIPTHTVCPQCGSYMGRKVVDIIEAKEKKRKPGR
jgi:large subunit ribosomal protein L32